MFAILVAACVTAPICCSNHQQYNYLNYYPYNCYFSSYSAYSPYSCPAPYAPYAAYGGYGCGGCGGCFGCAGCSGCAGGYDPYFSFGCSGNWGCAGWTPPMVCPPPPVVVCCGPIFLSPGDGTQDKGPQKDQTPEQQLDQILKTLQQIKAENAARDVKLKGIEDQLQKLKKSGKPKEGGPKPNPNANPEEVNTENPQDHALLQIEVPAGARLFVDDQPTASQGKPQRTVVTPKLTPGARYSYALRIEYQLGGTTLTQTQAVSFQAGQVVAVRFDPAKGVALETSYSGQ